MFAWLTEHASWILTTRTITECGKTPYQLARGSKFGRDLLGFAERIWYKVPSGKAQNSLEGKLGARWRDGVFLGYSRDSYEYVVWDKSNREIVMPRSVKRKPSDKRQRAEICEQVKERPKIYCTEGNGLMQDKRKE